MEVPYETGWYVNGVPTSSECKQGYHVFEHEACRGCGREEFSYRNPLNCMYCNTIHERECDPKNPMRSGWTYQPKNPSQATWRHHLAEDNPRRFLTDEDVEWFTARGVSVHALTR